MNCFMPVNLMCRCSVRNELDEDGCGSAVRPGGTVRCTSRCDDYSGLKCSACKLISMISMLYCIAALFISDIVEAC